MKIVQAAVAVIIGVCLALAISVPLNATDIGGGSVQGYQAASRLDNGTVVQLVSKDAGKVTPAKQSNLQNMFGLVVDRSQLPITISSGDDQNQVYVAASGTYPALVSTQAGAIKSGDYVTLSAVDGVLMKAGTEEKTVFGRANAGFDESGVVLGTVPLKDVDGNNNQTVKLGTVPVTINIQRNPNIKSTKADVPEFLERIGQAIAEKEVSAVRIYLSLGITAVSIIAAIAILYSGVRNSVVSIGRNPMSKKSIFRALLEIILTSILILSIGLFAVYLLLRL